MEAWPIEDVWFRPVVSCLVAGLLPWCLERGLQRLAGDHVSGRGRLILEVAELIVAWSVGVTALGPAWVDAPWGGAAHLFALVTVTAAALARMRLTGGSIGGVVRWSGLALVMAVFGTLVDSASWSAGFGGAVLVAVQLRRALLGQDRGDRLALGAAAGLAVLVFAAAGSLGTLTSLSADEALHAGASAGRWRLRVQPWDGNAMLAVGWASRRSEEYRRAAAQAREAVRMGVPEALALELESEVAAARGRCDEARALFERSLTTDAAVAFASTAPLTAPLTLGGFHLPPALVTECGGLDQLPGVGDLTERREGGDDLASPRPTEEEEERVGPGTDDRSSSASPPADDR